MPSDGATVLIDGRNGSGKQLSRCWFGIWFRQFPAADFAFDQVPAARALATTEIFGPVLSLVHVQTLEEGIEILARSPYGNMASIFTTSGAAARKFRYEVPAGKRGRSILA